MGGREVLASTAALTREGRGTCVGVPVAEVEVRILRLSDEAMERFSEDLCLPRGEIGEIAVRGSYISRRYDQREEHNRLSKIHCDDGTWFHRMGDVGYLDDEGRLWFCGRKAHRVETEEGLLFSVPCEAIYENDERVARAALVWLGERPRQTPVICVELSEGVAESDSLRRELMERGRAHENTKSIERLLFHPGFPVDRRHNAKIEREKLATWASAQLEKVAA
jgi:acyl-CoA synthetase (AMP-forming)/AMP-acid ligase II